jgi:hypothetical protein
MARLDHAEVPSVERQEEVGSVTFRESDHRGVGGAER